MTLLSINEAAAKGVNKLRKPNWTDKRDHLEFYILPDKSLGPWVKLWSPTNALMGYPNPYNMLILDFKDFDERCWEEYHDI